MCSVGMATPLAPISCGRWFTETLTLNIKIHTNANQN